MSFLFCLDKWVRIFISYLEKFLIPIFLFLDLMKSKMVISR